MTNFWVAWAKLLPCVMCRSLSSTAVNAVTPLNNLVMNLLYLINNYQFSSNFHKSACYELEKCGLCSRVFYFAFRSVSGS
jgi:hypothetical protein